jgi:ectoine hydroxylase-related dioxygenase (phytanoyl-CoA dioxygenase family)
VYPGCIGEPKKLHTDLPGFVNNPLSFVKKKGFVLNVIIYLNDVDENLAPIRISPKTNLNYLDINNYLRLKKNIKKNINLVHASDIGVDEKIILDLKYEIKKIQGKKGTVIFFSSNTLHSATENKTNKSRIHLNFNFGRREDLEVRKFNYKLMKNENINIYNYVNNFNDKKILQRSYIDSFKNKFLNKYYEYYSKIENMIND